MGINNHTLAFPDLVSLEAWHSMPDEDGRQAVHIDASFSEAKIGDDSNSRVRFRLNLKRADISLISSSSAGRLIIQRSVAREKIAHGILETVKTSSFERGTHVKASVALSDKPALGASASADSASSLDQASTAKLSKSISEINWNHRLDQLGNHCWSVSPVNMSVLIGKPWDPVAEPRLKFRRDRAESDLDDPFVVKVSCRREDFEISDIVSKSSSVQESLIARAKRNRLVAAEAAIRAIIETEGLPLSDLNEAYSKVYVAETVVLPEVE
jgi:hypothetical protein